MSEYFSHPNALVESENVGRGTRVWAFAHILPGAVIGEDCNICDGVFIENDVVVGDRVTVKCGVQLWDGVRLEEDVFVGPNATFTNDRFPRSRQHLESYPVTTVRKGASIGANATILPGLNIGQFAMVGAGAVVTKDVPPHAIVVGNPARISGYVPSAGREPQPAVSPTGQPLPPVSVRGVSLMELPIIQDLRGGLSYAEVEAGLPFIPRRYFLVFDVPSKDVRGEHAHRECHQLLVCTRGSCTVMLDDGENRAELVLDRPNLALHIPPMVWASQYKYSQDAVLLVLASDVYKADDYVRDYDRFLEELRAGRT